MPRERDPFHKYVEYVDTTMWKCRFCDNKYRGGATRIRAHLAGRPGKGIKGCEKVDPHVRAEALQTFNGEGSVLDTSTGGTSHEGMEGTDFGASQMYPNDAQNSNQPGCAPQQPSYCWPIGTGTDSACPEDQVSLPLDSRELNNLDNTQQLDLPNLQLDAAHGNEIISPVQQLLEDLANLPSFDLNGLLASPERPALLESGSEQQNARGLSSFPNDQVLGNSMSSELPEFIGDGITPDTQLSSGWSNLYHPPLENRLESREEIQTNEVHNPTVGSSLQIDSSLDVDGADRLQDWGQLREEEVVPMRSNTSLTATVQHPGQLPPRCDEEDGNDIHRFPSQTRMEIDPSTASQHTSNSCSFEATILDSQVLEAPTDTIGPSSSQELNMNEGAPTTSHPNTGNDFEGNRDLKRKLKLPYRKEADIRDELEFAASLLLKKPRMEVTNWLAAVEKLRNDYIEAASNDCLPLHRQVDILMREAEDLGGQGKGLFEVRETKVSKLVEERMVGEAFQRNTTKILEYLLGNEISRLGIYGMGGVGKTTIMVHIHNRLLKEANYGNVLWITVSQDFNTQRLQDDLWKELGQGALQEKDVRKRAAKLWDSLTKIGKSTIILDDVWEHFDLKEVGIPDGIKLVLTTRSYQVCQNMQCQEEIKIEPLSHIEAESLFLEEVGSEVALILANEAIAKSIVKECAGLPLAIITMARSMRGVTDVFEWEDFLEKLRESDMGQTDMEKKVLIKLEFSYNRLGNHEVQQCFLSCALYPEDECINKFELIEFFIDQGLIGRLNTREKQYVRGLTILKKLANVCLLEDHGREMKMHDLIRDMALNIMTATSIVKARKELRTIPCEEYWTDALEKVSLMDNEIGEFPLNMSPNCPKLSTFLINGNWRNNVVIPDSFFKQLLGLKVLNLSSCNLRELPDSISDLVNLRALILRECKDLRCIPYLGKLISLRKLDIFGCARVKVIKGLEMLVNLRYLNIADTRIKRLPKEILVALRNLQYLSTGVINEEDIAKLSALETLECQSEVVDDVEEDVNEDADEEDGDEDVDEDGDDEEDGDKDVDDVDEDGDEDVDDAGDLQCLFEYVDNFNKLVRLVNKQRNNPRNYRLEIGQTTLGIYKTSDDIEFEERTVGIFVRSHAIVSAGGESRGGGICILIPQDVQKLTACNCDGATNLSSMGPLENLDHLRIDNWKNLRVLCGEQDEETIDTHNSPAPTPASPLFPSLTILKISECPKLKYLFGHGPKLYLPHLQGIEIIRCKEMGGITAAVTPPPHLPPAFPSLEYIYVYACGKMKRVVESEWMPHFPKLRSITVAFCENMEEIIGCPPPYMLGEAISLEQLEVHLCSSMRRLFSHEWLIHLRNLQKIYVECCKGMVEMISGAGQGQEGSITTPVNNTSSSSQSSISLPKLKQLFLDYLSQLKSICEVPMTCNSMEKLVVTRCPELNRIPLQLRFRDIVDAPYIAVGSEEQWKTLIWDNPDAQALLQSHLRFDGSYCTLKGRHNSPSSAKKKWIPPEADFEEV